ncbi:MAG: LPS export ABC transporter permease LptG [Deltaproteobacteria bacterium]|nr:MAG: LPS export ABC transporter permease LptG [Deltaproteobacteria bacterium]
MKTLDIYIGTGFIRHFLIVLFILGFLFSFFEFLGQLDDIGTGSYQYSDALFFVIFTLPGRMLDLIPVSTLLGGIISLGLLADSNELLAMNVSGISVRRICWSVLAASAIPMFAWGILAEFVVPPLEQHARTRRVAALSGANIIFTKTGFWSRKKPFFIHVHKISAGGIPLDIDIFEWDSEGRLRVFTHARKAYIAKDRHWLLTNVEQKTIAGEEIITKNFPTLSLESLLSPEQMAIQEVPPESLSPSALYKYTRMLEKQGLNADQYQMVFWQKAATPISTAAMVLISLIFVFGPSRGITAGYRIMLGSIVGVALHFVNQIFAHIGLLLGINAAVVTLTPVAVVLYFSIRILSRTP